MNFAGASTCPVTALTARVQTQGIKNFAALLQTRRAQQKQNALSGSAELVRWAIGSTELDQYLG